MTCPFAKLLIVEGFRGTALMLDCSRFVLEQVVVFLHSIWLKDAAVTPLDGLPIQQLIFSTWIISSGSTEGRPVELQEASRYPRMPARSTNRSIERRR